jgi:hypothetical protein
MGSAPGTAVKMRMAQLAYLRYLMAAGLATSNIFR